MPPPYNPPGNPEQTLENFLYYVNPHNINLAELMNQFDPSAKVGITSYGPQFNGVSQIQMLFRQLFFAFTNLSFTQQIGSVLLFLRPIPGPNRERARRVAYSEQPVDRAHIVDQQ
jgi:hypothetical protein